jgi:hypothetical protein
MRKKSLLRQQRALLAKSQVWIVLIRVRKRISESQQVPESRHFNVPQLTPEPNFEAEPSEGLRTPSPSQSSTPPLTNAGHPG